MAGPSKVWDATTPSGPWTPSGPLSRGCSQQDFHRQSFVEHSVHMAEMSQLRSLFGEVTLHSELYEFHSCALYCEERHVVKMYRSLGLLLFFSL